MGIAARRILFLTSELPYPPEQGGSLRSYHLLRYATKHHAVTLLSFAARPREAEPLEEICERVLTVPTPHRSTPDRLRTLLLSGRPDMADRLASPTYAQTLYHTVTTYPFDYVQVQSIEMAPYGLMVQEWLADRAPTLVFDDFNAEYLLQRRALGADSRDPRRWPNALYSALQWRRLRRFERQVCQRADRVIAVSDADAAALRQLDPDLSPVVVPNGVETSHYQDLPAPPDDMREPAVLFTGKMDFRPNVDAVLWFHRHVWPQVRQEHPEARFYVVGKHPHPRLQPVRQDPTVVVTGYVPDVRPYMAGATLFVVPMRMGGGTRLKLLEAMAAGLPIVSTTMGAEGVDVADREHLLLANSPLAYAKAVCHLLGDATAREQLGQRAQARVVAWDWERIAPRLDAVYQA
ncbi:MAG: glycosyltransferase [Anaerolineae bacterium]